MAIIGRWRLKFLDIAYYIVSGITDGAADERWKVGMVGNAEGSELLSKVVEWVVNVFLVLLASFLNNESIAPSGDSFFGACGDEAVSTNFFTTDNAFE